MKHFSDAQWADFVRNLMEPTTRMEMQGHIDDGCQKCENTMQVWQKFLSLSQGESTFTPPADIVRVVESQFISAVPEVSSGLRLLFDSNLQPAAAGIRGGFVAARQFLYETDDYYIDLRLEPSWQANRTCLVGQILARKALQRKAEGVAVRLLKGQLPIANAMANRYGEFQLDFDVANDLWLSISRNERPEINFPLYGVHGKPLKIDDLD